MVAEGGSELFLPLLLFHILALCTPFGMATGFGDASVNGTIFLVNLFNAGYFQLLIIFLDLMIVLCWCFWDSSEKFIPSLVSFSIVLS